MKLLKSLAFALLLSSSLMNQNLQAANNKTHHIINGYPAKTIVIKHPAANDTKTFFSGSQVYNFEIYKVGKAEDVNKIIHSFLNNKDVATCTAGTVTGDFTAITLTLKSNKDKAWFAAQFKKAGLNNIKINQGEVTPVDKL